MCVPRLSAEGQKKSPNCYLDQFDRNRHSIADLGFYRVYYLDEFYGEVVALELKATTYDDVYFSRAANSEVDLVLVLLSSEFGTDTNGFINQGTVEAVAEAVWDGADGWYLEDISLSVLDTLHAIFPVAQSQEILFFEDFSTRSSSIY